MMNPDPVALLEDFALRISRRVRPQMTRDEIWRYVAIMMQVAAECPDWIDGLPEADRALFYDALYAPLRPITTSRAH